MFKNQQAQAIGHYSGQTLLNDYMNAKTPECEDSLGSRLETTHYTVNRIESSIEKLNSILFGESNPTDECSRGLSSIEDAVGCIKHNTECIEKALERIVYRLSGNN